MTPEDTAHLVQIRETYLKDEHPAVAVVFHYLYGEADHNTGRLHGTTPDELHHRYRLPRDTLHHAILVLMEKGLVEWDTAAGDLLMRNIAFGRHAPTQNVVSLNPWHAPPSNAPTREDIASQPVTESVPGTDQGVEYAVAATDSDLRFEQFAIAVEDCLGHLGTDDTLVLQHAWDAVERREGKHDSEAGVLGQTIRDTWPEIIAGLADIAPTLDSVLQYLKHSGWEGRDETPDSIFGTMTEDELVEAGNKMLAKAARTAVTPPLARQPRETPRQYFLRMYRKVGEGEAFTAKGGA